MNLKQIEHEALHLSEEDRDALAQKLWISLEPSLEEEIASEWLSEATQRAKDIDAGIVQSIPAEEVRRKAHALLR